MRNRLRAVVLVVSLCVAARIAAAEVDLDALARIGADSKKQLEASASKWTVTATLPTGAHAILDIIRTPARERIAFSAEYQGRRLEILQLIIRDDRWFVTDSAGSSKWRPYELPTESILFYHILALSRPSFVDRKMLEFFGTAKKVDGNIATFAVPLEPALAAATRKMLSDVEGLLAQKADDAEATKLREKMAKLKTLLAEGVQTPVDLTTGQVMEFGSDAFRVRTSELHILPSILENTFAVDGTKFGDRADDPTTGNRDDLLMIAHFAGYQRGMKEYEVDGRLMDAATGRFRRIPFQGTQCMPGCFTKDRKGVIVVGLDIGGGALRPFRIDLVTGENVPLGGRVFDSGLSFGGALSPDGRTIVISHKGPAQGLLEWQLYTIDLQTSEARPIGKPLDTGNVSWMPDGRRLLFVIRKTISMDKPSETTLGVMDLDGKITPLCKGNDPVVLHAQKRILFEDQQTRLLQTCDLEGKDIKLYADGLAGHSFAAPAPDGKRLLLMRFQKGDVPKPLVFPIDSPGGKALTDTGGLWAYPAWR